jgi:hypothetical protein
MTNFTKHFVSFFAICTFLILAIASSNDKEAEQQVATLEATEPAIQVSSKQLYADYEAK